MLTKKNHIDPGWGLQHESQTLIADDEPIARKVLREELESMVDVEIVGEAEDGTTAIGEDCTYAKARPA